MNSDNLSVDALHPLLPGGDEQPGLIEVRHVGAGQQVPTVSQNRPRRCAVVATVTGVPTGMPVPSRSAGVVYRRRAAAAAAVLTIRNVAGAKPNA